VSVAEEIRALFSDLREVLELESETGIREFRVSERHPAWAGEKTKAVPGPEQGPSSLEELRALIGDCKRCRLHRGRRHIVFGEGDPHARLVFIGEGPGRQEDRTGKPFVGHAGELLTRIIAAMGLRRDQVYICNVVKCRPPGNRDPEPDEAAACLPFLEAQVRLIRPEVICVLGSVAGRNLLSKDFRIRRDRGKWQTYCGIPVMPTYHPAYLQRNPAAKRETWQDVQAVMGRLGLEVNRNGRKMRG